jgi:hypothetical protein
VLISSFLFHIPYRTRCQRIYFEGFGSGLGSSVLRPPQLAQDLGTFSSETFIIRSEHHVYIFVCIKREREREMITIHS